MSKSSIKERNKAIRQAWEREQQLVQVGKGTRDWTKEQQQDILDPNKGKAYDDKGRAFEGQHMKSAVEYPMYQSNPDNIQFLTRDEHLEAHKGSWQNPTNWYYDPVEKTFHDFGEGEIIPCKVIELSNPVITLKESESIKGEEIGNETKNEQFEKETSIEEQSIADVRSPKSVYTNIGVVNNVRKTICYNKGNIVKRAFKAIVQTIKDDPVGTTEFLIGVVSTILANASESKSSRNIGKGKSRPVQPTAPTSNISNEVKMLKEPLEKIDRASPIEHPVSGYVRIQNGKTVNVKSYTRGGKK